jgi:hypothetical protein
MTYLGTVDEAKKLFDDIGMPVPALYNPAEFFVNRISDSRIAHQIVNHMDKKVENENNFSYANLSQGSNDDLKFAKVELPWIEQVMLLSHRTLLSFLHSPKQYLIEFLILIVRIQQTSTTELIVLINFI